MFMCYKCGRKLTKEQIRFLTQKIKLSENEKYTLSDVTYRICPFCKEVTTFVRSFLEDRDIFRPPESDVRLKTKVIMQVLQKAGMSYDVDFIARWIRNHYVLQRLLIVDEDYIQKIVKEVVENA